MLLAAPAAAADGRRRSYGGGMDIMNGEVRLHVEADGDPTAPPLLLLHGITQSGATWEWLLPDLAPGYRVLRLDFRGHGQSDRAPGTYNFPSYVSDAVAVCEQVAGAPVAVIGHSLGGGTGAALGQQRPDLARALVLEDPAIMERPDDIEENSLMDGFRLMRESVPALQQGGIPLDVLRDTLASAPSPVGTPFGELVHADALDVMARTLLQLDATVLDPVLDGTMVQAFDPSKPIPVPTLVLAADPTSPDAVVRPEDAERLVATSPLAECRVMAGSGHLMHDSLGQRDAFRDAVLAFLAEHPA
jgi:esterase